MFCQCLVMHDPWASPVKHFESLSLYRTGRDVHLAHDVLHLDLCHFPKYIGGEPD